MFDNLLAKRKGKQNKARLLRICLDLIEKYEVNSKAISKSCNNDMESGITRQIEVFSSEIENWDDYDTDYVEIAHKLLVEISFNLLASGKYHLYAGILNPLNCSGSLLRVHNNSLLWAVEKGVITEEEMDEQTRNLRRYIKEMG